MYLLSKIKWTLALVLFTGLGFQALAQTNDTPMSAYQWKGKKTLAQEGYVVLKSGKRLDGIISLKGSPQYVEEINYEGNGRQFLLPVSALASYGLQGNNKSEGGTSATSYGPINESPASMYEWKLVGEVMEKEIHVSVPRDGYVEMRNGKRYEGVLKLKKKAGVLTNFEVKTSSGKEKGKIQEVSRYGYNMSKEELEQQQFEAMKLDYYPGKLISEDTETEGEIAIVPMAGKFYGKGVLFKTKNGKIKEFKADAVDVVIQRVEGKERKMIAVKGAIVEEEFHGKNFMLYRNPQPTTVNNFASSLVKSGAQMGTSIAAGAIANKDAEKRGYESNMDSIIRVASTEELIAIQEGMIGLAGYSSKEDFMERAPDGSLKSNVAAIDLALIGREIGASDLEIFNKEWIIKNLQTGEETVVYKNDFDDLMEPLLKGCYEYLTMEKSDQRACRNWNNLHQTLQMLDNCY